MIFTGIFYYILDSKNRLFIPSRFRKNIKVFFIAPGIDNCIYLYSPQHWNQILSKFDNLNLKNKYQERAFKRAFLGNTTEVKIDKFGRIIIPTPLKIHAGMKKEVVIVGVFNRIEIWSKQNWDKYYDYAKNVVEKLSDDLEI